MIVVREAAAAAVLSVVLNVVAGAQVTQRNAQYWLPAPYNHQFYNIHTHAARSFYAAHYAHFGLYEVGLTAGESMDSAMVRLEQEIRGLVVSPPKFEPPIDVVAPRWIQIAYPTAAAMDWTHHLHEQLYDILTDDRVEDKKAAGERAIAHYLTNERAAFSTRGYGHSFMMAGGSWAGTFARKYPRINGILWAYHWHHAAVYEALMEEDPDARRREVDRVIRVFVDSVLVDPPAYMPLNAQVAPRFGKMFPAAAHIFDNLHMMHDVVNDIMVDDGIPVERKGAEVERMLQQQIYANQDWVIPPPLPSDAHDQMPMSVMTVPTQLSDGSWLPQGHPEARAAMEMGQMPHDTTSTHRGRSQGGRNQ